MEKGQPLTVEEYPSPNPPTYGDQDKSPNELERTLSIRDQRTKRHIRTLRFISRVLSLILSAFMIAALSHALLKFYQTRLQVVDGTFAWPQPSPVLWPTFMSLAIAAITLIMNVFTVLAYTCGVGAANRLNSLEGYVAYLIQLVHAILWAVSMGLFQMANTGNDLWGYSCSNMPSVVAIQNLHQSEVNFGMLCETQTGSWWSSVVESINYVVMAVIYAFVFLRRRHKKALQKARSQNNMPQTF